MPEEKSLIDMAREHMEKSGIDPKNPVDLEHVSPEEEETQPVTHPVQGEPTPDKEEKSGVTDVVDGSYGDVLSELLSEVKVNSDWRPLLLPSRGKSYVSCDEEIEIKPFTFAQERKLRSVKNVRGGRDIIKILFADCVKGLEYDSMTLTDKNYILFKLREISYGDDYTLEATCEHCESKNELSIKISEIPVEYAGDDFKEPLEIILPDSKQKLVFVSPRSKDEKYFSDMELLTQNMWRFMVSIGKYSEQKIKKAFLENTTVKDVAFFRERLVKDYYGMKTEMVFQCASCEEDSKGTIPFNENFFSVS